MQMDWRSEETSRMHAVTIHTITPAFVSSVAHTDSLKMERLLVLNVEPNQINECRKGNSPHDSFLIYNL